MNIGEKDVPYQKEMLGRRVDVQLYFIDIYAFFISTGQVLDTNGISK